mmetsp:Transcript_28107/g.110505  ORF Transcript_28107/g.110505 Transcript_28107/m.110505 type:complete len:478 (-) Transcript_28107:1159-2592(-)
MTTMATTQCSASFSMTFMMRSGREYNVLLRTKTSMLPQTLALPIHRGTRFGSFTRFGRYASLSLSHGPYPMPWMWSNINLYQPELFLSGGPICIQNFSSQRSFGFAEKWNLAEAPNREIRRAMERENKKERTRAKKEFNQMVCQGSSTAPQTTGMFPSQVSTLTPVHHVLVFILHVVTRLFNSSEIWSHRAHMGVSHLFWPHDLQAASEARAAEGKREKAQRRKEWEAVKDKELEYVDELIEQMELNQPDDEARQDSNEYYCSACKKRFRWPELFPMPKPVADYLPVVCISSSVSLLSFRSKAQWMNHEKSKKHKERVQAIQEELLANDDEFQKVHLVQESVIAGPAEQSPEQPLGRDEDQSDQEGQDEEEDSDAEERGSGETGGNGAQDGASDPAERSVESYGDELQYMQISRAKDKKKKRKAHARQRRMQQADDFTVPESSSDEDQRTPNSRPRPQNVSFNLSNAKTQPSQAAGK